VSDETEELELDGDARLEDPVDMDGTVLEVGDRVRWHDLIFGATPFECVIKEVSPVMADSADGRIRPVLVQPGFSRREPQWVNPSLRLRRVGDPKIFCFINGGAGTDWVNSMAMAEDGTCLAQHVSSSSGWAVRDIGYTEGSSDELTGPGLAKHKIYAEHYPDGYETVWVEDPRNHGGLTRAFLRNQKMEIEEEGTACQD
jgi:hypothetical protein